MGHPCDCDLDMDLATQVQQLLFPKSSPLCDWCCIGIKNRMASGLGGDYYDFITMPDGCQAIFVGDVTGHGLHASVVMSLLYGFIHRCTCGPCDPAQVVGQVNQFLQSFASRSEMWDHLFSSTLFFGIIDPGNLHMSYVNAGHPAPLVRRGNGIHPLSATTSPVGFFDAPEITTSSFEFTEGDRFLLYTDGIIEGQNQLGAFFGQERLKQFLAREVGDHLEFLDRLFATLKDFGISDSPTDDCTALVIDFHGF